jgi:LytS/YehU family sensor histidine kinase
MIFALAALACFLFITILPDFVFSEGMWREHGPPRGQGGDGPEGMRSPNRFPLLREIYHHLFPFLIVLVLSLLFRIYTRWKQAEKEKANAELSYLKAQINPHFLFNTLNTIYSLVIKKSPDTADAVLKLSGMMRYVLTEGNNTFVTLDKEIEYITDYVELQKIRVQRSVQLSYEVSGAPEGQRIAPLLLIPFIENAFKYGVNPEEESAISIHISIDGNVILMNVHNKKVKLSGKKEVKSGLGIDNTRERLQLLYPGAHRLNINDSKDFFTVELTIKLA